MEFILARSALIKLCVGHNSSNKQTNKQQLFLYDKFAKNAWRNLNCWLLAIVDMLASCPSMRACINMSLGIDFSSKDSLLQSLETFYSNDAKKGKDERLCGDVFHSRTFRDVGEAISYIRDHDDSLDTFNTYMLVTLKIECTKCGYENGRSAIVDVPLQDLYRYIAKGIKNHARVDHIFKETRKIPKLTNMYESLGCWNCSGKMFLVSQQYLPLHDFCVNFYQISTGKRYIPLWDGDYSLKCIVFFVNGNHYYSWQFDTNKRKFVMFNMNEQEVVEFPKDFQGFELSNVMYTVFEKQ
jgi:hypothetical protein